MNLIYLKRAILWIILLILTLIKFWIKNPQETPTILIFVFKKIDSLPRFLLRIVLTEKHAKKLKYSLQSTAKLYHQFNHKFNLNNRKSYKKLNLILNNKFQLLYFIIRKTKPKVVVETGVAAGESTSYILQALNDNNNGGKLYSIDLPFQWYIYGSHKLHMDSLLPGEKPGHLIPHHLKTKWNLILGNTNNKLPDLMKKLGMIDIFFHDSEHSDKTMLFEYNQSWPYIKQGGLLMSDDVSYSKAFDQFSEEKKVKKIIFRNLGLIQKHG